MRMLLIESGRPVGYAQKVGETTLYARDGHVFTGERVPHDLALPETSLRTVHGERVFPGDVVELRAEDGAVEERVVLTELTTVLFGRPEAMGTEPARGPLLRKLGSVHTTPYYRRRYASVLGSRAQSEASGWTALGLALSLDLGALASAGPQLVLTGSIEPLTTMVGAALGLGLGLWRHARSGAQLRHQYLLQLATRASSLNAGLFAALYLMSFGEGGPTVLAAGTLGMGGLGFLGTFALMAVLGNALDHYGGAASKPSDEA